MSERTAPQTLKDCRENASCIQSILANMAEFRDANAEEFRRIFKVSLADYWDNRFGFDVIKFDEVLQPDEGVSSYEATLSRFGPDGLLLIKKLIGVEEGEKRETTAESA